MNFVVGKDSEAAGTSDHVAERDEPFGGIILIPMECVSVVHRELMVEVMIALAHGEKSGNEVVAWGKNIVVGRRAKVMCDGVDAERALVRRQK